MERTYHTCFYVGGDHNEIEYRSKHRNNSRANREDAMRHIRRRYEKHIADRAEITATWRSED